MDTIIERTLREAPTAPWTVRHGSPTDHRQFLISAVMALAIVTAAFGRGFLPGAPPPARPHTPLVLVHASAFASWIVLFAFQSSLIATGRVHAHRRVGIISVALAALMLMLGFAVAVQAARTGYAPVPGIDPLEFLVTPLADLIVFAPLVGAAIYWRRTPDVHKRLMWLATTMLLFPAVTRLPGAQGKVPLVFGLFVAVLAFAPLYERFAIGRAHRVSVWGGLAVLASLPIRHALGATEAWRAFAAWLVK